MEQDKKAVKVFFDRLKNNITMEKVIVRLVLAWLLTAVCFYVKTGLPFYSADYAAGINLPMYLCFIVLFFVFFCGLGYFRIFTWAETYGPMILVTVYGFLAVSEEGNAGFCFAVGLVLALTVLYAVHKVRIFAEIKKKSTVVIIYAVSGLIFLGYVGSIGVFRYLTYRSPTFDFGIWSQMFYYMKNTFLPLTTCERAGIGLMSHFSVHFSPIYYLYLPFYMLFSTPVTLNILQAVTLASGFVPLFLLCGRKGLSKSATAVFAVIFALFPALACGTFYDLHENCFLVPLLLWLFYFLEREDLRGILIFTVLTLLVKEDAPLYTACIGLYMILSGKKRGGGLAVLAVSVVYFAVVTVLMQRFGLGIMDSRFSNYTAAGSVGGIWDLIRNFTANPAYVLTQCFDTERLEYLLYVFWPIGFLPLAGKKIAGFVLLLPMIVENLAPSWQYQHSIFFQYTFGTTAILFYLAIVNYAQLSEKARRFLSSLAVCGAIILLPVGTLTKTYYFTDYSDSYEAISALNEMVETIPREASVTASTFILPHLADRDVIYEYPAQERTDYVVLDLRWNGDEEATVQSVLADGYVLEMYVENVYAVFTKAD